MVVHFCVLFIPYFRLLVFGILVTLVAWFSFLFFRLAHLALQNVNKDYIIFSYFNNFVTKSDQKPKTKNGRNETINTQWNCNFFPYNFVWQFHPQFMINILLKSLQNNSALFLRCQRISHYDDMITHFLCKRRQGTTHLPSRRIVHTSLTMVHLNASWVMKFEV